jgi:hypothetical protein
MTVAHLLFGIIIAWLVFSAVGTFLVTRYASKEDQQHCDDLMSRYEPEDEQFRQMEAKTMILQRMRGF